ncbi:rod shape-determining protein RodA [Gangjinia marincola]|uniref:Cell wall polymerase n=1 Tax=Gangjinia marincola TaxID=578463 RepID=A0ABN1MH30_9FLAO
MAGSNAKIDWITVLLFILLVGFGWGNIYSASLTDEFTSIFDINQVYGKQSIRILMSIVLIVLILSIQAKFYERFASIIYILSLLSLLGLYVFGKEISGATSWYDLGVANLQPSEFAKAATALALAKYVSDLQVNIFEFKHQLRALLIIGLPVVFIAPQPDPGSAIVFLSLLIPLYREGLSKYYINTGLVAVAVFVITLIISPLYTSILAVLIAVVYFYLKKEQRSLWLIVATILAIAFFIFFLENEQYYLSAIILGLVIVYTVLSIKQKNVLPKILMLLFLVISFSFSGDYIFENVFAQRHRDRFNIVLGKQVDNQGIGYNTAQSEIAIGSGGWTGKGWTQGTQTKGKFVPEQHTDYIFSTVGEEWGFLGSSLVIVLFTLLLLRIYMISERQKSQFNRVYGYGVLSILFIHFSINIGMVLGIFPTVGIPLPFFSYGGSALWGFTILLFILVKLDSKRMFYE